MDKITIWDRQSGHGVWVFNHIEPGWNEDEKPTTDRQAEYWDKCQWRKFYAYENAMGEIINSL